MTNIFEELAEIVNEASEANGNHSNNFDREQAGEAVQGCCMVWVALALALGCAFSFLLSIGGL